MELNAVSLTDVSRSFGSTLALDHVSLDLPIGTVIGLLGVNGAGKSTLIRILLGLDKPDDGDVNVLGMDPIEDPIAVRSRVGYLPERRALYDWMTVEESIGFVSSFYPSWNAARADDFRARFDLPLDRKVGALSRGQYARLAFLLTLGHDPELFVLDEPSYGLDPLVRRQFLATIVDVIAEGGKTVVMASHLMNEVERVADRVAIMHRGRMLVDEDLPSLLATTKLVKLPPDFDFAPFADRLIRSGRVDGHVHASFRNFDDAIAMRLPSSASVQPLSLEDIFCEFAEAADELPVPSEDSPA